MDEKRLKEFGAQFEGRADSGLPEAIEGEAYICRNCSPKTPVSFEDAAGLKFRCANCGSVLEFLERGAAKRY